MTKKLQKKSIELKKVRIPLRKLLHGCEIREAAENLKNFRLKLLEEELLQGAKLTIKVESYSSDFNLIATRLETDKEFEDRLEKARLAAEAKKEREAKRKLVEAEKKKRDAELRKQNVAQRAKEMALSNGISVEELTEMLKST
jgi:hypothetical protein